MENLEKLVNKLNFYAKSDINVMRASAQKAFNFQL